MSGKRRQRPCRICRKRPPWRYKNCPPGVCKRCYHKHIWAERPSKQGQEPIPVRPAPGWEFEYIPDTDLGEQLSDGLEFEYMISRGFVYRPYPVEPSEDEDDPF
jgi:hypothetical protein